MIFTRKKILYFGIGTVFVVIAIHASYIGGGFVGIDHGDIEYGRALRPLSDISGIFTERFGQTGFYRPLVTFFNSLDARVYGRAIYGFRLTNILLHAIFAVAVYFFARSFFLCTQKEGLFVMLVAGVHPLSWPIVGAVHYRSELLVAIFTLAAVGAHISARVKGKKVYVALTFLFFLAALFSKETALVWIPALMLYWEIFLCSLPQSSLKKRFSRILFSLEIFAIILYSFLRAYAVPELWRVVAVHFSFSEALGMRLGALGWQFAYLVSPILPALSDAMPRMGVLHPLVLGTVALLVLSVFVLWRKGFSSLEGRAFVFLALALASALNIIPTPRFTSPHYGYLATAGVGVVFLIIWRYAREYSEWGGRFLIGLGAAWVVVASILVFHGGFRFENDKILFVPEVARDGHFLEGHYFLGNYYFNLKDYSSAAHEYEEALKVSPNIIAHIDVSSVVINLAEVRIEQNQLEAADELLKNIAKDAGGLEILVAYNRARIAYARRNFADVVTLLTLEDYNWKVPEPPLLLADSLIRLGRNKEAVDMLIRFLPLFNEEDQIQARAFIAEQLQADQSRQR